MTRSTCGFVDGLAATDVELLGKIIARRKTPNTDGQEQHRRADAAPLQKGVTRRRTGLKGFTLIVSITFAATTVLAV